MPRLQKPSQERSRRASSVIAHSLVPRQSLDDLYEEGKSLRKKCPRKSHAIWKPPPNRPDPVRLLDESNKGRILQLIPIRHGRMMQTPFTFYRGAALNMVADLASTPATGLRVQACGDAHLLNFGVFATPERREIFDINDLDETLPAPRGGTRSAWPQALLSPVGTTASAKTARGMRCSHAFDRIASTWPNSARCGCWTYGMRASISQT